MEKEFNYSILFKQAIQRIKCIRNPHAANPEFSDMKWDDVRNELLFDFGGNEHMKESLPRQRIFLYRVYILLF